METFNVIALALLAIITANLLSQVIPKIPQAFWQIIAGILLAFVPNVQQVLTINPEWFMMLVIAPLLFYEGQHTRARLISKNFIAIIRLAGILAIITVVAVSLLTKGLLAWSLPVAVALAAIVTPTDATALDSVTAGVRMPTGVKRALNLESLFNDASGLVVLELALIWLNTGHFSFWTGLATFVQAAFGGALCGLILGLVLVYVRQHLLKYQLNDLMAQIMIQVLSPVFIFALAEAVHVSGIIAVVIAGVVHNEERDRTQFMSTKLTNLSNQVWNILDQLLNGTVFVLLGIGLVKILGEFHVEHSGYWIKMIIIGLVIYVAMAGVRYVMIQQMHLTDVDDFLSASPTEHRREALVFAIGGVHGAMTMAMAFSLPFYIMGSHSFPHRDEILFIATIVIMASLLVPLISLPKILPQIEPDYQEDEYQKFHLQMINAGIATLDKAPISPTTKKKVMQQLESQLGYRQEHVDQAVRQEAAEQLQKVEWLAVTRAVQAGQLSNDALMLYRRYATANQEWGLTGTWAKIKLWYHLLVHNVRLKIEGHLSAKQQTKLQVKRLKKFIAQERDKLADLPLDKQKKLQKQIDLQITYLKKRATEINSDAASQEVRGHRKLIRWRRAYRDLEEILRPAVDTYIQMLTDQGQQPGLIMAMRELVAKREHRLADSVEADETVQEALVSALQAELNYIQDERMQGHMPASLAKDLYDEVNAAQAVALANTYDEE